MSSKNDLNHTVLELDVEYADREGFDFVESLPYPQLKFGASLGQQVSSVVFRPV